jgi:hypothetical protein
MLVECYIFRSLILTRIANHYTTRFPIEMQPTKNEPQDGTRYTFCSEYDFATISVSQARSGNLRRAR